MSTKEFLLWIRDRFEGLADFLYKTIEENK
jgi:hypothetical protein